jgi:DNA-binding cell septation regulator SpoVG
MQENQNKYLVDISKAEVKIQKVKAGSKVIARAEVFFDEKIKIKGFKIIQMNDNRLFVGPPSFGIKNHPIIWIENKEIWHKIEQAILDKYNEKDIEDYARKNL